MQELIERLIDAGTRTRRPTARATSTSTCARGPSTARSPDQSLDAMEPAADADPRGKRDPRDFALWKGAKAGEPAERDLGVALGRRPARLAHRVLGDVEALPRRGVRHPRRRTRPALPAPRERARPVDGGRRRRSRATGCTTASSPSTARRCRSRSATSLLAADVLAERDPLVVRYALARRALPLEPRHHRRRRSTRRRPRSSASAPSSSAPCARSQDDSGDVRIAADVPDAFRRGDGRRPRRAAGARRAARDACGPATPRSTTGDRDADGGGVRARCAIDDRRARHRPARPALATARERCRGIRSGRSRADA